MRGRLFGRRHSLLYNSRLFGDSFYSGHFICTINGRIVTLAGRYAIIYYALKSSCGLFTCTFGARASDSYSSMDYPIDADVEDILNDSLTLLGGEPVSENELIQYGPLKLTVAPKVP